jgi:hypothetical protein
VKGDGLSASSPLSRKGRRWPDPQVGPLTSFALVSYEEDGYADTSRKNLLVAPDSGVSRAGASAFRACLYAFDGSWWSVFRTSSESGGSG